MRIVVLGITVLATLWFMRAFESRNRPDMHVWHTYETEQEFRARDYPNGITLGEYLDLLRAIIQEGQDKGVFRHDLSPGLATDLVFGAVDELVNSWLLADDPGDLVRLSAPLMNLLSHGMVVPSHHGGEGT